MGVTLRLRCADPTQCKAICRTPHAPISLWLPGQLQPGYGAAFTHLPRPACILPCVGKAQQLLHRHLREGVGGHTSSIVDTSMSLC